MKKTVLAICCAALGAAALTGCSSDKYKPAELVPFTQAIAVGERWTASVPSSQSFLYPAAANDSVWVAGGNRLVRLNAYSGKEEWTVKFDSKVTAGVGSDGYIAAVGLLDGTLEVTDAEGKKVWSVNVGSELMGPPVIAHDLVIVRTTDYRITAYGASDGEQKWTYQKNAPALNVRLPVQMIASGPLLFAGQPNGQMVLIDIASGRAVFEFAVAQPKGITEVERLVDVVGAPAVKDDMLCGAAFQGALTCVNSQNGQPLWSKNVDAVTGPAIDEDNVYVVDVKGNVYAYYRQSGELRWENKTMTYRQVSAPVVMPGCVAVGDAEGYVHVLSPRTGEEIGRVRIKGAIQVPAQPFSSGAIYQTNDGGVAYIATR